MQAILAADYSFAPRESWRGVSETARNFISRCLTVDPKARMTAHEALQHPWVNAPFDPADPGYAAGENLLPTVKKNFNARRTLHKAIDAVRAINKLREGGHFMMDSVDPKPAAEDGGGGGGGSSQVGQQRQQVQVQQQPEGHGSAMDIDGRGDARGQTEEQIKAQERRVKEVVTGLWSRTAKHR